MKYVHKNGCLYLKLTNDIQVSINNLKEIKFMLMFFINDHYRFLFLVSSIQNRNNSRFEKDREIYQQFDEAYGI